MAPPAIDAVWVNFAVFLLGGLVQWIGKFLLYKLEGASGAKLAELAAVNVREDQSLKAEAAAFQYLTQALDDARERIQELEDRGGRK